MTRGRGPTSNDEAYERARFHGVPYTGSRIFSNSIFGCPAPSPHFFRSRPIPPSGGAVEGAPRHLPYETPLSRKNQTNTRQRPQPMSQRACVYKLWTRPRYTQTLDPHAGSDTRRSLRGTQGPHTLLQRRDTCPLRGRRSRAAAAMRFSDFWIALAPCITQAVERRWA